MCSITITVNRVNRVDIHKIICVTTRKTFGLRLGKLACIENRQQVSCDRPRRAPTGLHGDPRDPLGSMTTKVLYKQR